MPQTEIEETVASRDVEEMAVFYRREPWGAWRDNVHAALIITTLRNIFARKGTPASDWRDFMLMDPEERRQQKVGGFVNWLKQFAKKTDGRPRKARRKARS